ncbi:MAG TPA: hypothetical protein VHZ99_10635 [Steroidobacteraceae bacterium]|nr:hypothetical protein [Steroidobacteraceae bacterium]
MALASSAFYPKARSDGRSLGLPDARIAVFTHPLGGLSDQQLIERAVKLYESVREQLRKAPATAQPQAIASAQRVSVPADPAQLQQWFFVRQWSDGLPLIAPTPEAVAAMVTGSGRAAGEQIGVVPPRGGLATVEQIAVNAVMAGCRPQYMPVLIAAVDAMLDPAFNLASVQATTHPVAPLLIVHGPIAKALHMNAGAGTFGPGSMANAVIGRAVRLILWNIGGAIAGAADRSTQGAPSKFSFCIAENSDASPWRPFVTERGLPADADAVTVFGGEPPHNINDHEHGDAEGILHVAADVLRTLGGNPWFIAWHGRKQVMLILGPEHAASIASSGWSLSQVREFLHRATSRRHDELARGGMYGMRDWPAQFNALPGEALIPLVPHPDDILVLVAGGEGKHSAALPSFGATVAVTRPIGRG